MALPVRARAGPPSPKRIRAGVDDLSGFVVLLYHRLPVSTPHEVPGMKVSVDPIRCTGHGRCYALCPQVFQEDEAGRCVIEQEAVPRELRDRVRMAADNCPELAIRVAD